MAPKIDRALLAAAVTLGGLTLVACSSGDDNSQAQDDAGGSAEASVDAGHDAADATFPKPDAATDAGHEGDTGGGHDGDGGDASAIDAAGGDAGDGGAAIDAGDSGLVVDAGAVGTPCSPVNTVQTQACGSCGTQERVCLPASIDNPDGGSTTPVWQPWGFCQGQPANACLPGESSTEPCGLCGHRARICQLDCQYAYGTCNGEPVNKCTPGSTSYSSGLSCADGGGREEVCQADCTWGGFSDCEPPPYGKPVVIAGNVGGVITSPEYLAESATLPALTMSSCPVSIATPGAKNAYAFIEVRNPSALTATVSVWFSQAPSGPNIDTQIAAYDGAHPPTTDTLRSACDVDVNDSCFSQIATACQTGWGGLVVDDFSGGAVTIPPNASITVYAGAVNEVTSTLPHSGMFLLNTRTESLQ